DPAELAPDRNGGRDLPGLSVHADDRSTGTAGNPERGPERRDAVGIASDVDRSRRRCCDDEVGAHLAAGAAAARDRPRCDDVGSRAELKRTVRGHVRARRWSTEQTILAV